MGANDWEINSHVIMAPTEFRWMPRKALDVQGDNRPIYAGVRSAQLKWRLSSNEDWATLQAYFRTMESSGTATVRIPEMPTITGSAYAFREYSGCTISEPSVGPFFETYPKNVVLLVHNIVTE